MVKDQRKYSVTPANKSGQDSLSDGGRNVTVQIKYGDVEKTFSGNVEDVWLSLNKFFSEFLPSFDIAKKLVLSVDLQKIVKECEDLIAFSKEGCKFVGF